MAKIQFKTSRRRVGKTQPGVGEVHATTALGNQAPKRKAKDFLTVIGGEIGGAQVVQMPTLQVADVGKKDGLTTVYFMRHGATKFNNQTDMSQDRVRSWNDVPLTEEGREDAHKAGKKLQKYDIKTIVSSSLGRAKETAKIVKGEIGDPDIKVINTPKMLPWNLGKFTGQTTDEAHDGIAHYVENPDDEVPDGESFNDFRSRAFAGMAWAIKQAGGKPLLVISHHRNERLFATSGDPPRPDAEVDPEKFLKPGEDPGDVTTFDFDPRQLRGKAASKDNVGKVWDSNADLPDSVRNSLPDEAQTVFRRVANDRMRAGHGEVSSIKQAWTAVKNGWRKEGDKWVRKFALGEDTLHVFIEDQVEKLKGEFPFAGERKDLNVALHLTPIDAHSARSPFPYNQYFFANLRDDQKERVLAALTDQEELPVKLVRMSDLSAIQDRIDPNKVQSMLEGEPEKLPLVVRTAPGRVNIADGHHRLTAHLLTGAKTAQVRYVDVEPDDEQVVSDGNPGSKTEQKRWRPFRDFINSLAGTAGLFSYSKAGPEDEARDEHGRWTSGGYAAELKNSFGDNAKFDSIIERLRGDKSMKTHDVREIARQVLGYQLRSDKGRADAIKEITQMQAVRARQTARADVLDRTLHFEGKLKRDEGFSRAFEVKKVDEDQQLVFGWASIWTVDGEYVVDKQDDVIPPDEGERAAYDFVLYHRSQGDMHERMGVGRCVESIALTKQKQDALGIDLGMEGWWCGFYVDCAETWAKIKNGSRPEFSIGGRAERVPISDDELLNRGM